MVVWIILEGGGSSNGSHCGGGGVGRIKVIAAILLFHGSGFCVPFTTGGTSPSFGAVREEEQVDGLVFSATCATGRLDGRGNVGVDHVMSAELWRWRVMGWRRWWRRAWKVLLLLLNRFLRPCAGITILQTARLVVTNKTIALNLLDRTNRSCAACRPATKTAPTDVVDDSGRSGIAPVTGSRPFLRACVRA